MQKTRTCSQRVPGEEAEKLEGQSAKGVSGCPSLSDSQTKTNDKANNDDWMLLRPLFLELESKWGPFDIDACCDNQGHNAQVPDFCCPDRSFLTYNCEGKRVYMNPPFSSIEPFLDHYFLCKKKNPKTSGLFVLPEWTTATWFSKMSKTCQLVHTFPVGSLLF